MKTALKETPKNWSTLTIDELKGSQENSLSTGPFGSSIGSRFFLTEGVPVIRGSNLSTDGITHLVENDFVFISASKAAEFRRSSVTAGDLVFTCWGTINQIGLITERATYPRYIISNKQMKLTPAQNLILSLFLFYFFASPATQRLILAQSIGSTIPGFNLGQLRAMRVPTPPIAEQGAIVQALSDVDALTASLDRLIAKKSDIKQATMQQLLTGKTRLPGFSGKWEVKQLGDVVQIKKGQLITSSTLKQGDIPVIAGGKQPAYYHASANRFGRTITISASGASAGYVALYNYPIFASDCSTISESGSYSLDFIYYQLLSMQQTIYKSQTGGAQPHIHAKDLTPLKALVPSMPEQVAIAAVLSDMDAELSALEARRDKTRDLKQGMMQELLTGKTRLI